MRQPIRLGITAVASPLEVGAGDAPAVLTRLTAAFAATYGDRVELVSAGPAVNPASSAAAGRVFYDRRVDAICVAAVSWFEDYLVLDLLEECDVPLVAWARPGMETGALCGMQQLAFMLKNLNKSCVVLFGEPGDPDSLARAWDFVTAAALRRKLRRTAIGHLGHRVEGMTETTAHELALKKLFGVRVVGLDTQIFLERAAQIDAAHAAEAWRAVKGQVGSVTATDAAGETAMQVYAALRETLREQNLTAAAVGCYPHLMGKVCLGISLLAEEGLPVACEGDVNNAVSMVMLAELTGGPVHNTDLLDPIPAENAIVFSHCGNGGFSLAPSPDQIVLAPVRLMDSGVAALFPARPGPVTLVNLVATLSGYKLATLFGEATTTDMIFPGNPLRVRFRSDYRQILEWIVETGLGHHWMAGYGDVRRPLSDLAKMIGCELAVIA